eukprot:jgi/Botrbrau1/350/Bobra.110_2s0009.1
MWPALFSAVGPPSALLDDLLRAGQLTSAACCLLIVDRIEGAPAAHKFAVSLIGMALAEGMYQLVAELLRFIVPPADGGIPGKGPEASGSRPGSAAFRVPGAPIIDASGLGRATGGMNSSRPSSRSSTVKGWEGEEKAAVGLRSQQTAPSFWFGGWFRSSTPPEEIQRQTSSGVMLDGAIGGQKQESSREAAWRVIATHAWALVGAGRMRQVVRLSTILDGLSANLPALMISSTPHSISCTALSAVTALHIVRREFPNVDKDVEVRRSTEMLSSLCETLGLWDWFLALAVLRSDSSDFERVKAKNPDLVETFAVAIQDDDRLRSLYDANFRALRNPHLFPPLAEPREPSPSAAASVVDE